MSEGMSAAEPVPIDLWSEEAVAGHHRLFARLRDRGPVSYVRLSNGLDAWLVTHYEEARAAFADERLSIDPMNVDEARRRTFLALDDQGRPLLSHLLNTDPPDHTRLRRLVSRAFTPQRIETLRPRVREMADGLLDAISDPGRPADLIEAFAYPLTASAIAELLGVPVEDRDDFRDWTRELLTPPVENTDGQAAGILSMFGYLTEFIRRRRSELGADAAAESQPDLVSALIAASDEGGRLDEGELLNMVIVILTGGQDTTTGLIANGLLALFEHPDQLRLLRERPELLPVAIEELFRYDGPGSTAMPRFATRAVEIGDMTIPAGSVVFLAMSSANRDEGAFAGAAHLDITRTRNRHLALGHGVHTCLGAPLARLNSQVALGTLLRRYPDVRLACASDDLRWRSSALLRVLAELPVVLAPP